MGAARRGTHRRAARDVLDIERHAETVIDLIGGNDVENPSAAATIVRDAKTGQVVVVKGVGALKGDALRIRKSVSLLRPIAEQALRKRKAG